MILNINTVIAFLLEYLAYIFQCVTLFLTGNNDFIYCKWPNNMGHTLHTHE